MGIKVKELGHLVLYVRDIGRSRRFYKDALGWDEVMEPPAPGIALFSSGRTHHELLLIEVGQGATPIPEMPRVGMYHFGLKVGETDEELREAMKTLVDEGVEITGTGDHTVTHSIYIKDPDGNEIEIYIDVQPETWRDDPMAILAPVRPLRI